MKKKGGDGEIDEVEQLLQSAQDELLLKLSLDSHISRDGVSLDSRISRVGVSLESDPVLLPDLHRRFQALKSNPSKLQQQPPIPPPPQSHQPNVDEHDLLTRFAALKQKSPSSSTGTAVGAAADPTGFGRGDDSDEEDEVEKIIRWAKDAARLDPSPSSDEDEDDEADADEDDEDDEDDVADADEDDEAGVSRRTRK